MAQGTGETHSPSGLPLNLRERHPLNGTVFHSYLDALDFHKGSPTRLRHIVKQTLYDPHFATALSETERFVVATYPTGKSMERIGQDIGWSRERVRVVIRRACAKLDEVWRAEA